MADASGELLIFDDINFNVQGSTTLAIVGASGSDKSTLLSLLVELDTSSADTVRIYGTDIFVLDEDGRVSLRKDKRGFVFQSF